MAEENDIIRVAARLQHDEFGDCVNVYHFRKTDATPSTDNADVDDCCDLMDNLYDQINAFIHSTYSYYDINVFNVTQDRPLGSWSWDALTVGGAGGEMMPSQCAAYVQGNTGYSRSWARKFIGGLSETHNTNGKIAAALLAALTNFGVRWCLAVGNGALTSTWEPVIYSTKVAAWRVIADVIIRDVWATIRRRRKGRGA